MRIDGAPEKQAAREDNIVRATLGRATVSTVHTVFANTGLLVLTSDGVHHVLGRKAMADLIREHADSPQELAAALTEAACQTACESGDRDDASALVLRVPTDSSQAAESF